MKVEIGKGLAKGWSKQRGKKVQETEENNWEWDEVRNKDVRKGKGEIS